MADQPEAGSDPDGRVRKPVACVANETIDEIAASRARGEYIWLNLHAATNDEIAAAGDAFGLHPLTVEDLQEFDQRAKVEDYGSYVYIVSYGATLAEEDDDQLVEIHIIYAPDFLVTVAAEESLELGKLHDQAEDRNFSGHELLREVLDVLIDSYGPLLDVFDAEIEKLEERVVARDLHGLEFEIHDVRKRIGRVSRIVHREIESFTRIHEILRRMPDHNKLDAPYFRDLMDHLIRTADSADAQHDRVSNLFELYIAALDNKQNIVMKQFTVIAGIFLPLSVLTGFFGMNFAWLVKNIDTGFAFLLLGIVLPLVILIALLSLFAWRGLFRE